METITVDIGGVDLSAFSIDTNHSHTDLELIIKKELKKSKPNATKVAETVRRINHFSSFDDLQVEIFPEPYSVPEPLKPYRQALGVKLDSMRKVGRDIPKNGPVAMVDGKVEVPLRLRQGGYYDWSATIPNEVPYKLEEELSRAPQILEQILFAVRESSPGKLLDSTVFNFERLAQVYKQIMGVYQPGKTVREILAEKEISEEKRGRYLGCAYILFANSGKEWVFTQRVKNLGVLADCMTTPGSVLSPRIRKGFNLGKFMKAHLDSEAEEEFGLEPQDFDISGFTLYDDRDSMPFMAVRMTTPLTTREIAEKCYGSSETLKEHNLLYSVSIDEIKPALERLPLFPGVDYVMQDFLKR